MPAYSYKERFVPFVKEGSKPHTIRERRKHPAKPGDMLYHYFGMRTKWCTKLREEVCTDVRTIVIGKFKERHGFIALFDRRLTDEEMQLFWEGKIVPAFLSELQKDLLAWQDGFRPEGSSFLHPKGSFELMLRYWGQNHELPWLGDIIYWHPKKLNK